MSRYEEQFPDCRERKADCLSYKTGRCSCLRDTNFTRSCPFYCTAQMIVEKLPKELAREVFNRYEKGKLFKDFYGDD